ncbi:MAG: LptF/LptG family permease, partial [Acidobacteria bacterium]|nr:LptF/LptG family permease [Acidobacteriota bacterium]
GDQEHGLWEGVFIYWQDKNKPVRLITSRQGRIDVSGEQSELVLTDAVVITLPVGWPENIIIEGNQVTTERSAQLRIRDDHINLARNNLLKKISQRQPELDEMGWQQLRARSSMLNDEGQRKNASLALNKRLSLCLSPLIFAILGVGLGLRMRRGGRALGVGLSLLAMLFYYFFSLIGEQIGQMGELPPLVGAWLAYGISLFIGVGLIVNKGNALNAQRFITEFNAKSRIIEGRSKNGRRKLALLGLLDKSIFRMLLIYFIITFLVMISIFFTFTLFEMLRFATRTGFGLGILLRYIFFLTPLACVSVAPLATLISILVTFSLLVRRSESTAWWASGQSIYRLIVPGVVFAIGVGGGQYLIQEKILPEANHKQNALRSQIRGGSTVAETPSGREQWMVASNTRRIYSFMIGDKAGSLNLPTVYEFDELGVHLQRVVIGLNAFWTSPEVMVMKVPRIIEFRNTVVSVSTPNQDIPISGIESLDAIKPQLNKPAEADYDGLSAYIRSLNGRGEEKLRGYLSVALERKRSDPFAPLVMTFLGIPLALSFGKRGASTALFVAIFVGMSFAAFANGMQQLGTNDMLSAKIAAWSAPVIFSSIGIYLLSRSHT